MANLAKVKDAKLWVFQSYSDDCQATEFVLTWKLSPCLVRWRFFIYFFGYLLNERKIFIATVRTNGSIRVMKCKVYTTIWNMAAF